MNILKTPKIIVCLLLVFSISLVSCDSDKDYAIEWQWTFSTDFGRMPRWSSDGSQILFGDDRPGGSALWLWTPGGDPSMLSVSLPPHNWDYRWSPDGTKIAFTSPGEPGSPDAGVWIVDVELGSRERLYDRGSDVSWVYDGSAVVVRIDQPENGIPGIYEIGIDYFYLLFKVEGYFPLCSPAENLIAYSSSEINGKLYIIDSELVGEPVSENGALNWVWSADGSSVFCTVNDYTSGYIDWEIFKIFRRDTDWTADNVAQWASFPAPDRTGSRFAFMRISNGIWRGLWFQTGDGESRMIANYGHNPEFSPVDDRIAINAPNGGIRVLEKR